MTQNLNDWIASLQANGVQNTQTGASASYAQLKTIFDSYGIPEPIWLATLYHENRSLDPTTITATPKEYSVGLWQFNKKGGLGNGIATTTLQNPIASTRLAAQNMAELMNQYGASNDVPSMMSAIAHAWPGDPTGTDAQARAQTAQTVDQTLNPAPGPTLAQNASGFGQWLQYGLFGGTPGSLLHAAPNAPQSLKTAVDTKTGDLTLSEYVELVGIGLICILGSFFIFSASAKETVQHG